MAISCLEAAPQRDWLPIKCQADVINLPPVGCISNYAFPTMQLNVASAKPSDALARTSCLANSSLSLSHSIPLAGVRFAGELGTFAGRHCDKYDCSGGWTVMISMTDLAPGESPGYFILQEIGAAIGERIFYDNFPYH